MENLHAYGFLKSVQVNDKIALDYEACKNVHRYSFLSVFIWSKLWLVSQSSSIFRVGTLLKIPRRTLNFLFAFTMAKIKSTAYFVTRANVCTNAMPCIRTQRASVDAPCQVPLFPQPTSKVKYRYEVRNIWNRALHDGHVHKRRHEVLHRVGHRKNYRRHIFLLHGTSIFMQCRTRTDNR